MNNFQTYILEKRKYKIIVDPSSTWHNYMENKYFTISNKIFILF